MQGIKIEGVCKSFSGKPALMDVDLHIKRGTIHAIVGENGAGKTTLMNILCGVLSPTAGTVEIDGRKAVLKSPKDAAEYKIGMVHQHFMLVPVLKVWQNAILGIEPCGKLGKIDKKKAFKIIGDACKKYGIELPMEQVVGTMPVGEQQRIEILKVMIREAEYIILDEPTAVLTPRETERLFENIRAMKALGKTIIFISHKLEEVMTIADEITVLRLGEKIGTLKSEEASPEKLINMMVGRDVHINGTPMETKQGNVILEAKGLCTGRTEFANGLENISFELKAGEVLGVAGVDGNGQNELALAILGLEKVTSGAILKSGTELNRFSTSKIRSSGISFIPPDRQKQGLVMSSSMLMNTVLGCEDNKKIFNGIFFRSTMEKDIQQLSDSYDVRMPSLDAAAAELSGGNQQKAILAREFGLRDSDLIIAVNPTRGLDIGAIEFVYDQIEKQKAAGKAILLISTELSEVLRLSDRIAVLFKGRFMDILPGKTATVDQIGMLMAGIRGEKEQSNEAQ